MATKSNRQPLQQPSTKPHWATDWKQHPLVIAASSSAATALFIWQFVLPIQTARLDAKFELLEKDIANIEQLKRSATESKNRYDALNVDYQLLLNKNPFRGNSPYPNGYQNYVIGSNFRELTADPDADLKNIEKNDYFTINRRAGIFKSATIYKSDTSDKVNALLYFLQDDMAPVAVAHLRESFGTPTYINPKNDEPTWNVSGLWLTVKSSPDLLTISRHAPAPRLRENGKMETKSPEATSRK